MEVKEGALWLTQEEISSVKRGGVSANAVVTVVEVCLGCPSSFREASLDEEQRYGVTW